MIVIIMKYNMYIYIYICILYMIIVTATINNGYPKFLWINQAKTIGT